MSQYVESMLPSMGLTVDATGNIAPVPEPAVAAAAPAPAVAPAPAPARASSAAPAAKAVAPVKATTPTADIPEPPQVGQASPDEVAQAKKKTLLGG